jgi:hypothetical protein
MSNVSPAGGSHFSVEIFYKGILSTVDDNQELIEVLTSGGTVFLKLK